MDLSKDNAERMRKELSGGRSPNIPHPSKLVKFQNLHLLVDDKRTKHFVCIDRDSYLLAEYLAMNLAGRNYSSGLDMGCSSGIQAFVMARHCKKVIATDVNDRALEFGQFNADLNQVDNVFFLNSNLFQNLKRKKFDLIVTNPPFVFIPNELNIKHLDGFGGSFGLDIPFRIMHQVPNYLEKDGEFYMIVGSPILHGRDLLLEHLKKLDWGAITVQPLRHFIYHEFHGYHKKHGISHSVLYIIKIKKGKHSMEIKPLPQFKWFLDNLEMAAMKFFY